jgi:hypothetical protein
MRKCSRRRRRVPSQILFFFLLLLKMREQQRERALFSASLSFSRNVTLLAMIKMATN